MKLKLFIFFFLFDNLCIHAWSHAVVETKYGKLLGQVSSNWDNENYFSFQSIPYAKPPVKGLRFKAPEKRQPWEGILDATKPSPMCPQYFFNDVIGKEDCLYLNIYTRSLDENSNLPVMVYIHGGGYMMGSGNSETYGADYLMTQDIVLVTFNYRLGYLGAISFKDQTQGVPGNAHLKDQVMALQWVQENIHHFGGNNSLVTIFGTSVGGASTHMHMLSPMSKGLVHRAIAQSGCALNTWNYGLLGTGDLIAEKLGLSGRPTKEIIEKLQEIPFKEFIRKVQVPNSFIVPVDVPNQFSLVIEMQTNEPAFLTKPIIDLIPNASNIPLMLGYNNNDSLVFQVSSRLFFGSHHVVSDVYETIPSDLDLSKEQRDDLVTSIRETFFDSKPEMSNNNVGAVSEYENGPWFAAGYLQAIEKHLEAGHELYFYTFSSDTLLNFFKRMHPVTAQYKGACHMDELGYLFRIPNQPCFERNSIEEKSLRNTVKIWTNFARYGKPTTSTDSVQIGKITDKNNIEYMNVLYEKIEKQYEPAKKLWKFWQNVYETYKRVSN